MEELIKIDLNNKNDLLDKYNNKNISDDIIKYIIKKARKIPQYKRIKIIINKKSDINIDTTELIKQGLKEAYNTSIQERNCNNLKQFMFFGLGIFFIFLSTLIEKKGIWKEILLITGWVPIWEMIEVELFPDVYGRRKRRIIKKLLDSQIIENIIEE